MINSMFCLNLFYAVISELEIKTFIDNILYNFHRKNYTDLLKYAASQTEWLGLNVSKNINEVQ